MTPLKKTRVYVQSLELSDEMQCTQAPICKKLIAVMCSVETVDIKQEIEKYSYAIKVNVTSKNSIVLCYFNEQSLKVEECFGFYRAVILVTQNQSLT